MVYEIYLAYLHSIEGLQGNPEEAGWYDSDDRMSYQTLNWQHQSTECKKSK